jgi:predicted RND superfamily exporter protein
MPYLFRSMMAHRLPVACGLVLVIALAIAGLPRLKINDNVLDLFRSTESRQKEELRSPPAYGAGENDCVLVLECDDFFLPQRIERLRRSLEQISALPQIESVSSIFDVRGPRRVGRRLLLPLVPATDVSPERIARAGQHALEHPLVRGHMLSQDGRTMLVILRLKGGKLSVREIDGALQPVREILKEELGDAAIEFSFTGVPLVRSEVVRSIQRDQIVFDLLALTMCVGAAVFLFRRVAASIIVLIGGLLGMLFTLGGMGWLGLEINPFSSVITTLIPVIGLTDSVHVMYHARRAVARGVAPCEAAAQAAEEVWAACWLTAITSSIGFGSLYLTNVTAVRQFGVIAAVGVIISCVAVLTAVPLMISVVPGAWLTGTESERHRALPERIVGRLTGFVIAYRRELAIGGTLLTLALVPCWFLMRSDNRLLEYLPQNSEPYRALKDCEAAMGGGLYVQVTMEWPRGKSFKSREVLERVREVHNVLGERSVISDPFSVYSILESVARDRMQPLGSLRELDLVPDEVLARFVDQKESRAIVIAHMRDAGASVANEELSEIEHELAAIAAKHPGYRFELSGPVITVYESVGGMIASLAQSLGFAALSIFCSIAIFLRSIRLGLISLLPNLLPLVAVAAFLVIFDWPLQFASVIVFNVCIGLATDDSIHFLHSFKESFRETRNTQTAVRRTMANVGPAVLFTSFVFCAAFAPMMLSNMPPLRVFGGLACLAFASGLVGELLLHPALLLCLVRSPREQSKEVAEAKSRAND